MESEMLARELRDETNRTEEEKRREGKGKEGSFGQLAGSIDFLRTNLNSR